MININLFIQRVCRGGCVRACVCVCLMIYGFRLRFALLELVELLAETIIEYIVPCLHSIQLMLLFRSTRIVS